MMSNSILFSTDLRQLNVIQEKHQLFFEKSFPLMYYFRKK